MPKGWSSGILGNTSLTPNTGGTSNTLTPGLLDQYKSPAPVKKLVSASGDEVHFDNGGGTTGNSTNQSPPGTNGNNGTNFAQNLGNVQNASNLNGNEEYQNLASQNNTLVQAQNNASEAGLGGVNTLNANDTANLGPEGADNEIKFLLESVPT